MSEMRKFNCPHCGGPIEVAVEDSAPPATPAKSHGWGWLAGGGCLGMVVVVGAVVVAAAIGLAVLLGGDAARFADYGRNLAEGSGGQPKMRLGVMGTTLLLANDETATWGAAVLFFDESSGFSCTLRDVRPGETAEVDPSQARDGKGRAYSARQKIPGTVMVKVLGRPGVEFRWDSLSQRYVRKP